MCVEEGRAGGREGKGRAHCSEVRQKRRGIIERERNTQGNEEREIEAVQEKRRIERSCTNLTSVCAGYSRVSVIRLSAVRGYPSQ